MDTEGHNGSSQSSGRGQKRSSERIPKLHKRFKSEDRWSLTEKTRLLEALKRYDVHNITNIAKLIGTKSEEEVEDKIHELKGKDSTKGSSDRVGGPSSKKAPIEAWIDLVQEMTRHEPCDYSQFISKILGLITRNEEFEDSGYAQLKWRNIYQFLADITEDRVEVQKLTDLESLVVLDLMHSLGDTLHKSETSEQRHILDYKYNLLNFKSDNPTKAEREINIYRIAQALSNDFWEAEDVPGTEATRPDSSASSSAETVNVENPHLQNEVGLENGCTVNMSTTSTSENSQWSKPGTSASASSGTAPVKVTSQGSSGKISGLNQSNPQKLEPDECSVKDGGGSGVELLHSRRFGKKFERPKYFTLNPLCMPTQTLAFRPKNVEQGGECE